MANDDRYIIDRNNFNASYSHFLLTQNVDHDKDDEPVSFRERRKRQYVSYLLHGCDVTTQKLLRQTKPAERLINYIDNIERKVGRMPRKVCTKPNRILEAPNVINDFYTFLIDWSTNDVLALALDTKVYVWHAKTNQSAEFVTNGATTNGDVDETAYISCLKWHKRAEWLAVTNLAERRVDVWDYQTSKRIVDLRTNADQIVAQSWNENVLSCGSVEGNIFHFDVRASSSPVTITKTNDNVCGLEWSPNGSFLASGTNQNVLVWDRTVLGNGKPMLVNRVHSAAVKAIAWCPWKSNVLASGGGYQDRSVRIWNVRNGKQIVFANTDSQVTSILWCEQFKEVLSAHGRPHFSLKLWTYPRMELIEELKAHSERILHAVLSSDGTCVAALSADETLSIWNCFAMDLTRRAQRKCGPAGRQSLAFPLVNTIR